jgi:acyl dehydratase
MKIKRFTFDNLHDFIGQELGVSDWLTVDQEQINRFAECTGDRQWIHVDVERARREGPFGEPVAHGYLVLSLAAPTGFEVLLEPLGVKHAFNYGLEKVRFISPVRAGTRIRNRMSLISIEEKPGSRLLLSINNRIEIESEAKPAMTAVTLVMIER